MSPANVPSVQVAEMPSDALLLDVREDDEWAAGHIEQAMHVPMHTLPGKLSSDPGPITTEASIVVICAVGGRSAQVTAWLVQQGYNAVNLVGGMHAWAAAGRAMISDTGAAPTVL